MISMLLSPLLSHILSQLLSQLRAWATKDGPDAGLVVWERDRGSWKGRFPSTKCKSGRGLAHVSGGFAGGEACPPSSEQGGQGGQSDQGGQGSQDGQGGQGGQGGHRVQGGQGGQGG